jgi:hypothetical protein
VATAFPVPLKSNFRQIIKLDTQKYHFKILLAVERMLLTISIDYHHHPWLSTAQHFHAIHQASRLVPSDVIIASTPDHHCVDDDILGGLPSYQVKEEPPLGHFRIGSKGCTVAGEPLS